MHDPEKSHSAVVAVKPPNRAGSPAAEAVEPRAGTKGNADQQSTHRTQTRERVTQALNRVRQAARQRKKERFPVKPAPEPQASRVHLHRMVGHALTEPAPEFADWTEVAAAALCVPGSADAVTARQKTRTQR